MLISFGMYLMFCQVYCILDKPFPPGTPRVEDSIDDGTRSCVKTSCTLSWDKPTSNQVSKGDSQAQLWYKIAPNGSILTRLGMQGS